MQKVSDEPQYEHLNPRLTERRSGIINTHRNRGPSKLFCKACNQPEYSLSMCPNCKQNYCQDCMVYGRNTCRDCSNIENRKAEQTHYIISKDRPISFFRYLCVCFKSN